MKNKIVIISVIALVAMAAVFMHWRTARIKKPLKKPAIVSVTKKKVPALPSITKKVKHPKIAIVMDDFGYNMNNVEALFDIGEPVTLSILPNLKYSSQIANLARSRGYEVILHLPLEPQRKDVKEEPDTIKSGLSDAEIALILEKDMASVSGLSGVSNHMGSKSTEDKALMATIFGHLKNRKLYFFDSLTSENSVCRETARTVGIRYARRDIFLDNFSSVKDVEKQLLTLRRFAFSKGRAIAVCHDRKNTITALAKVMPEMASEGVQFVALTELVN